MPWKTYDLSVKVRPWERGGLVSLDNLERFISGKLPWFIPLPSTSVWSPSKPHRESCCQASDGAVFYCVDQSTL